MAIKLTSKESRRAISTPLKMAALLVLAVAIGLAWHFISRESFKSIAIKASRAIKEGNGELLLDAMAKEERDAYGLTGRQWTSFLQSYVLARMRSAREVGEPSEELNNSLDQFALTHRYIRPDGTYSALRLTIANTADGPRSVGVVDSIMNFVAVLERGGTSLKSEKLRLFESLAGLCQEDDEELVSLGLNGIYKRDPHGIRTWSELGKSFDRAASRLRSRLDPDKTKG